MTESILPAIYPRLIRRVQAFIIDSFIFSFVSVGLLLLDTPFEGVIATGLGIIWTISAVLILVGGWKSL